MTANASSQSSSAMSGVSSVEASTPAQFTRMCSSGPTASNSARTESSSETSVRWPELRLATVTEAPPASSRSATAWPIPDPPPVTTAILPANSVTRNMIPDRQLLPRW